MPLPLPNLDTRRWTDLVEEARAMIPRYARGWTDHNTSDPGITLVQLLAWLVEMDVYQLNRVPDAHRRKFLSLVGVTPLPPQPAKTALGIAPVATVDIPKGAEFAATTPEGKTIVFSAQERLHAAPVNLQVVRVQGSASALPVDMTRAWSEGNAVALLGSDPKVGAALWLGFDQALPTGETVRLGFYFAGESGARERQRIVTEERAARDACKPAAPTMTECAPTDSASSAEAQDTLLEHHSVKVVWEFYAAEWKAFNPEKDEVRDDTRALTLDGMVELRVPEAMTGLDAGDGMSRFYIRVRMASGDYDAPPSLTNLVVNALGVEQSTAPLQVWNINAGVSAVGTVPTIPGIAHLKFELDAGGFISALEFTEDDDAPQAEILFYQATTASAAGALVVDLAPIGIGNGLPLQSITLPQAQVSEDSFELYSVEASEIKRWVGHADFDASDGRARTFVLDSMPGAVHFGDGDHGRIPPKGAWLVARYRATQGAAGNVKPGAVSSGANGNGLAPSLANWMRFDAADFGGVVATSGWATILGTPRAKAWQMLSSASYTAAVNAIGRVSQTRATWGGADQESLAHAAGRAVEMLNAVTRAITSDDYESLALETPGTRIARVHALPGQHPSFPCYRAPGVVTVIVVPAQQRAKLMPSAGLLQKVLQYLNRRRLLGTHIEVVAPRYVTVQVTAEVKALTGANLTRVKADVLAALDAFLHPLTGGAAALPAPTPQAIPSATTNSPLAPGVTLLTAPVPPAPPIIPTPTPQPGWQFGRDVFRSEVLQLIDSVAGVDHVLSLDLAADGGTADCGNLCVGATELVVSGQHSIQVS